MDPIKEIEIKIGKEAIKGTLIIPAKAKSIVIFAHGSGSSRFSSRNKYVAKVLQKADFATLLLDLLTAKEDQVDEQTREFRFNIPLLAERVVLATQWIQKNKSTQNLAVGYFGASTGAAAALIAAAKLPIIVKAVVSRGGRPDLALEYCPKVKAPALLIVGEWDEPVIEMNREALAALRGEKKLLIVPGATHLFEEPGKLEEAATLAKGWFERWLKP